MNNPFQENVQDTQPYTPQPGQTFDINAAPPPRRFPWGCLLGGCLGTMLLILLGIGLLTYAGYAFYQRQIAKYTSEAPVELPSVDISDEEIEAVSTRFEDFRKQFESGEAPQELVITEEEINALIAGNPELKGHVYVKIEDGNLRADVSFPTDQIPGGKGRYFNGSATLHVELENGVLVANVVDAEANGTPIPEEFMTEFRKQNLAKDMYKNVETAEALQRCESLVVEEDRIVLKVRQKPVVEDSNPPDSPALPGDSTDSEPTPGQPPEPPDSPSAPNL